MWLSKSYYNYIFKNNGNTTFSKANEDWSLSHIGFSNGAAYGDLDNDGDLDLVINNIDQEVAIFRNDMQTSSAQNYLKIKLSGNEKNIHGIGLSLIHISEPTRPY